MNSESVRIGQDFKEFINRGVNNVNFKRTEKNPNHKAITQIGFASLIEKYFKLINDRYIELVDMGLKND